MLLKDTPLNIHQHFTGQMLRLKDVMEHKVNKRIEKFPHGENEITDEETKTKILATIDRLFDEVFEAVTIN